MPSEVLPVAHQQLFLRTLEQIDLSANLPRLALVQRPDVDAQVHAFPGVMGLDREKALPGDARDPLPVSRLPNDEPTPRIDIRVGPPE